ncbi:hypothetical protein ACH35V_01785 [Actinomadura sp. 1N219]|uniref:hypothetical protein n=1 Tax=Actinomadura sp. 1N219 TaxID=3375152 RepID=UPI0037AA0717
MTNLRLLLRRRHRTVAVLLPTLITAALLAAPTPSTAGEQRIATIRSSVKGTDGKPYSVTNHLDRKAAGNGDRPREWLLAWGGADQKGAGDSPNPDFLAVIDVTRGSSSYGKVVNTVTIDSKFGNEPHHMQYVWHKGQKVYAGGLLSDTTYVFDVARLPLVGLSGITLPHDTPCGSAPDAYSVLKDGTAYATYMGGPDVTGPCTYTNGEVRYGNGYGGTPGEVVRLDQKGRVLAEAPAAMAKAEPSYCLNIPALPKASCANPHGIAVREDLNRVVTSDFAEVRNMLNPETPPPPRVARETVRTFDVKNRNNPELVNVTRVPVGPRNDPGKFGIGIESYMVMETVATNKPRNRGAFASTMSGGAVFYTPDITAKKPRWREVFDDTTAFKSLFPTNTPKASSDGGSWLMVSPDDRYLFHTVLKAGPDSPAANKNEGMVYVLDIKKLLASGPEPKCSIDTFQEVGAGGAEPDCPALVSALPVTDLTSGGPHWAAMDNLRPGPGGKYLETEKIRRLAVSNYFVKDTYSDGNHQVCMINVGPGGGLSLDRTFRDENTRKPCVDFNRQVWPHGSRGAARPHGVLFVAADRDVLPGLADAGR